MERFFGGNPALVVLRLVILSLIVGVVLAALGFSPYDLLQNIRDLAQRIYDMGFTAVEKAFRYFLLGAVIVFPVWVVMRVFKMLGREPVNEVAETGRQER
jgi:cell division protein FtsL